MLQSSTITSTVQPVSAFYSSIDMYGNGKGGKRLLDIREETVLLLFIQKLQSSHLPDKPLNRVLTS